MLNNCKETKLPSPHLIQRMTWRGSSVQLSLPYTCLPPTCPHDGDLCWWREQGRGCGNALKQGPDVCIHASLLRNPIQMTLLWGKANSSNVTLYQQLPTSLTIFTIGYSIRSKISYTSRQIHTWTYCTLSLWLSIITSKTWSLIMNLIHRSQGALWNYKNSTLTRPSEITVEEWMNYSEAQS